MQGTPCLTIAALGGKGVGVTGIKFLIFLCYFLLIKQKKVEASPRRGAQVNSNKKAAK